MRAYRCVLIPSLVLAVLWFEFSSLNVESKLVRSTGKTTRRGNRKKIVDSEKPFRISGTARTSKNNTKRPSKGKAPSLNKKRVSRADEDEDDNDDDEESDDWNVEDDFNQMRPSRYRKRIGAGRGNIQQSGNSGMSSWTSGVSSLSKKGKSMFGGAFGNPWKKKTSVYRTGLDVDYEDEEFLDDEDEEEMENIGDSEKEKAPMTILAGSQKPVSASQPSRNIASATSKQSHRKARGTSATAHSLSRSRGGRAAAIVDPDADEYEYEDEDEEADEGGSRIGKTAEEGEGDGSADPFVAVASFLHALNAVYEKEDESAAPGQWGKQYSEKEIARAVSALASTNIMKSMDGATHQLRNTFKDSSSLQSRYEKFMASATTKKGKSATTSAAPARSTLSRDGVAKKEGQPRQRQEDSPKKLRKSQYKEAAKVYEYTTAVERGLQAAEILQAIQTSDAKTRGKYLQSAGLVEIARFPVRSEDGLIRCVASLLTQPEQPQPHRESGKAGGASAAEIRRLQSTPERYKSGELVIAIVDEDPNSREFRDNTMEISPVSMNKSARGLKNSKKIGRLSSTKHAEEKESGRGGTGRQEKGLEGTTAGLLSSLAKTPTVDVVLSGVGFAKEELTVNPSLVHMAKRVLKSAAGVLIPGLQSPAHADPLLRIRNSNNSNNNNNGGGAEISKYSVETRLELHQIGNDTQEAITSEGEKSPSFGKISENSTENILENSQNSTTQLPAVSVATAKRDPQLRQERVTSVSQFVAQISSQSGGRLSSSEEFRSSSVSRTVNGRTSIEVSTSHNRVRIKGAAVSPEPPRLVTLSRKEGGGGEEERNVEQGRERSVREVEKGGGEMESSESKQQRQEHAALGIKLIDAHEPVCRTDTDTTSMRSPLGRREQFLGDRGNGSGKRRFTSVRVVGYSAGAAVSAYVAMILDGALNSTSLFSPEEDIDAEGGEKGTEGEKEGEKSSDDDADIGSSPSSNATTTVMLATDSPSNAPKIRKYEKTDSRKTENSEFVKLETVSIRAETISLPINNGENAKSSDERRIRMMDLVGLYKNSVTCMCLAPPPCVSRTLVPKYVTTLACGDDIVVRASPHALDSLRERVGSALRSGAGKQGVMGGLGWTLGAGWVSDLASVGAKSLSRYTGGEHDLSGLSLPGRVFFMKSRKLKQGATMQRIQRGNWQEDMLWQMHEVLLSRKMLSHHALSYYISVLDRC